MLFFKEKDVKKIIDGVKFEKLALKIHACNLKRPGKAETNIEGSDVRDFILATGHTAVR